MTCYALGDLHPKIDASVYIAPAATIIGAVTLQAGASIWPGVVIRADNEPITIGEKSNIQENSVLHVDEGIPLTIGANVTVGHQAMLHGCTIKDGSLIGIQAIVLNGAVIGRNCLVGAGALVTENKVFPDNSLILGSPARVVRSLSAEEISALAGSAQHYFERAALFKEQLKPLA